MEEIIKLLDQADGEIRKEFEEIKHTPGAPVKREHLRDAREQVQKAITSMLLAKSIGG